MKELEEQRICFTYCIYCICFTYCIYCICFIYCIYLIFIVFLLLGDSTASGFYVSTFRNNLCSIFIDSGSLHRL
jgi:hypothetical protein